MIGEMQKLSTICAVLFVSVFFAACGTVSVHPLSDPEKAVNDERLTGLWIAKIEKEIVFAHFLLKGESTTEIITVSTKGSGKGDWPVFNMFPSRIGGESYMNVKLVVHNGKAPDDREKNYGLVRYRISIDGVLTVWRLNEKAIIEDIEGGKVEGEVKRGRWVNKAKITASTNQLAQYVRNSDQERLFGELIGSFRKR